MFQAIFLAKTGSDRPGKGEKNFRPEFRSYWTPERKFRKKQKKKKSKNLFPALFLAIMDEISRKSEKKILVPNYDHTRPGEENYEKNINKTKN